MALVEVPTLTPDAEIGRHRSSIPTLTHSLLHRCFQRHGISRLPDLDGDKPARKNVKKYPIGAVHIDITEVQTEEGKLLTQYRKLEAA